MRKRLTPEERRDRRRRAVQRSKFALPSIVTMISVLCGFSSVVMSLNAAGDNPQGYFLWAAVLLVLAGVFDGLDGRIARATNTATEFGVQLDSLADALSFGMAPAILAYRYGFFQLGMVDHQLRAVGWAASFFFIACGALRLARFNVYQSGSRDSFTGLPIPAAGGAIASLVLFTEYWNVHVAFWVLGPFTLILAALMVSPIRYPKDRMKKGLVFDPRNAFRALVFAGLTIAALHYMAVHSPAMVLFPLFVTYILFGIIDDSITRLRSRKGVRVPEGQSTVVPFAAPVNKDEAL